MSSKVVSSSAHDARSTVTVRELVLSKQGLLASIALFAAALCFWATAVNSVSASLRDVLLSVGTSLATVGIVTAVARWLELERWRSREMANTLSEVILKEFGDSSGRRLGIELLTIDELARFNLEEFANGARTIYLVFLFEPALVGTNALTKWIASPNNLDRTMHVFLPDLTDSDFIKALARRHNTTEHTLRRDIETALSHFESAQHDHPDRLFIRHVPAPGPTYSGYLFDPEATLTKVETKDVSEWSEDRQRRRAIVRFYRQRMEKGEDRPTIVAEDGRFWDLVYEDFQRLIVLTEQPGSRPLSQNRTFGTLADAFAYVRNTINETVDPSRKALDVLGLTLFSIWRPHLQNWLYDEESTSLSGWTIRITGLSKNQHGDSAVPQQWSDDAKSSLLGIAVAAQSGSLAARNIKLESWGFDFLPAIHGFRFKGGDVLLAIMHPPEAVQSERTFAPNYTYELIPADSDSAGSRDKRLIFDKWFERSRQLEIRTVEDGGTREK